MRTGEHSPVPTLVQGIGFAPTLAVRCWVIQQRFGEVLQTDHHGRWYTRRLPGNDYVSRQGKSTRAMLEEQYMRIASR